MVGHKRQESVCDQKNLIVLGTQDKKWYRKKKNLIVRGTQENK